MKILITTSVSCRIGPLSGVRESLHTLDPLSQVYSAQLFARLCPHTRTSREAKVAINLAMEHDEIVRLNGIPRLIIDFAYSLDRNDYDRMVKEVLNKIKTACEDEAECSSTEKDC